jgi:hypothetical protein
MWAVVISDRAAREALSALVDEDISAAVGEEDARMERAEIDAALAAEWGDQASELDALVEEWEREWSAADRTESWRVSREMTDQVRARRTHRRAGRSAMRSLSLHRGRRGGDEVA